MGVQIIKQPNGKYALFSSICDGITHYNMSPRDIIEQWVADYRTKITKNVISTCNKLEQNIPPYYQLTLTWEEAIEIHTRQFPPIQLDNTTQEENKSIRLIA